MGSSSSMYIGVTGLNSFSLALSVVADNVANANTTGFKANSVRFGDMVSSFYSTQSADTDRAGSGSAILGIATDYSAGPMLSTNEWSDVAINGEGFFTVRTPSGQVLYTRDGSFHLDNEGYLVNFQGYNVLDSEGSEIIRVEDLSGGQQRQFSNYSIDADGRLWGTDDTGAVVQLADGNQIGITTFPNPDGLIRQGANLYSAGPQAGTSQIGVPNQEGRGFLLDLTLENSNVDLAMEMVNMIIYQADYNANSKTILTASEMMETVTNLIR